MANSIAQTFTKLLNNTTAFKIPSNSGVTKVSFQFVSGVVTIRGNLASLATTTTSDVASSLSDSVITLSSSITGLTVIANGATPLSITVDSSAGSAVMIAYIGG